jgi:hypothetical protein
MGVESRLEDRGLLGLSNSGETGKEPVSLCPTIPERIPVPLREGRKGKEKEHQHL